MSLSTHVALVSTLTLVPGLLAVAPPTAAAGASIDRVVVPGEAVEDRPFTVLVTGSIDADLVGSVGVHVVANAPGRACEETVDANAAGAVATAVVPVLTPVVREEVGLRLTQAGDAALCVYLDDVLVPGRRPVAAYPAGVVRVREPAVALSVVLPAPRVEPGEPVALTVHGSAEVDRVMSVQVNPATSGCGATPAANAEATVGQWLPATPLLGTQVVDVTDAVAPSRRGTYRLCGYVADELDPQRPALRTGDAVFGVGQLPVDPARGGEFGATCRPVRTVLRRGSPLRLRCSTELGTLRITASRAGVRRAFTVTPDDGAASVPTSGRFPRGTVRIVVRDRGRRIAAFSIRLR